ncbi:DUF4123 domain-containing protein [Aestuariibius sp. 2305UL40-4]|uniref:DUF4123 domain-containing protein n=1 Tax=Aestuariibius violaceus TaxID=3234132 RepID=UPI00345EDEC2
MDIIDVEAPAPIHDLFQETSSELPARHVDCLFGETKLYAVLDAVRMPSVAEYAAAEDLPHCNLYADMDESLQVVGPWLVELSKEAGLTRALVTDDGSINAFWSKEPGIFIQTSADLEVLQRHLMRLVRPSDDSGKPVYFRFWDPGVLRDYLARIADWPERIFSLFLLPDDAELEIIICDASSGRLRKASMVGDWPKPSRPAYRRDVTLTARDRMHFAQGRLPAMKAELAAWLKRADPVRFRPFDAARINRLVSHGLAEGSTFKFRYKEEYAYFLYMMTFLGGWFHRSPVYSVFVDPLKSKPEGRYVRMRQRFPVIYQSFFSKVPPPPVALEELETGVMDGIAQRGDLASVTVEDTKNLARRFEALMNLDGERLELVRQEAMEACDRVSLSERRDRGMFYLLWLTLGVRFHEDPLFPWVREKLFVTADMSENLDQTIRYALRRLQRTNALSRVLTHA